MASLAQKPQTRPKHAPLQHTPIQLIGSSEKRKNSDAFFVEAVRWPWTGVQCPRPARILDCATGVADTGQRSPYGTVGGWCLGSDRNGPLPASMPCHWRLSTAGSWRTLTGGGAFTGCLLKESRRAVPRQQRPARRRGARGVRGRRATHARRHRRDVKVHDHTPADGGGLVGPTRVCSPRLCACAAGTGCLADSASLAHCRPAAVSAVCHARSRQLFATRRGGGAPAGAPRRACAPSRGGPSLHRAADAGRARRPW